jgi:NADPH:quinone reductase-like Zn-dependent oxidoreductase
MKAIVQDTYGEADVLQLRDIEKPVPEADHVLIRVRAAGVDQGVWHLMSGLPTLARLAFGISRPKNPVRGREVAGTIESVGANVAGFAPGDAVYGTCEASFAEFAVARPDRLAPKPESLSFEQAAAMPVSAGTALLAVRGRVAPGDRVLVLGAAGGVGSFAVQLAKHYGAEVTGVSSGAKLDLVRSVGADHVIDYASGDIGTGYDLIIDTGGNRSLGALRAAMKPSGTAVLVGGEGASGKVLQGFDRQLRAGMLSPFLSQTILGLIASESTQQLRDLTELVAAGALKPAVDRVFPLAEAADAMRYLRAGKVRGKVVLSI